MGIITLIHLAGGFGGLTSVLSVCVSRWQVVLFLCLMASWAAVLLAWRIQIKKRKRLIYQNKLVCAVFHWQHHETGLLWTDLAGSRV